FWGPVVDERTGRVFVPGYGRVSVLDVWKGTILRTSAVGGDPGPVAVDEQTGRAFVTGTDHSGVGHVRVLDAARGRLVRTGTVGRMPQEVTVDGSSEHAFVVNQGGDSISVLDARSGA